jgi:hypothetical protein
VSARNAQKVAALRQTPTEILDRYERLAVDPTLLLYASWMTAKADRAALQDGYQLYRRMPSFTRCDRVPAASVIGVDATAHGHLGARGHRPAFVRAPPPL